MLMLYPCVLAVTASLALATQLSLVNDVLDGCTHDHSSVVGTGSRWASVNSDNGGGGPRKFLVNLPSSYRTGIPMGMIISYHGRSKNATEQELLSQFSDENYNPDLIAVYPQGKNDSWQGASYHNASISDTQFTYDLLMYMRRNYCIDDSRIYANGKSNGGGFVDTLACNRTVGGNFAAFAPVSGALYTDVNDSSPCDPAYTVTPMLEFHGFSDHIICYDCGHSAYGPIPAIPSWLQRWARRNGCVGDPPVNQTTVTPYIQDDTTEVFVTHSTWSCGSNSNVVQGYNISGLGHQWPSTQTNDDNCHTGPSVIDATPIILDFFRNHTLPLKHAS